MPKTLAEKTDILETKIKVEGVRVGKIVKIEKGGEVWVDYPGNTRGPVAARRTGSIKMESLQDAAHSNKEVLLVFENNDPERPIIIDILYSPIDDLLAASAVTVVTDKPDDVLMDGKRMVFDAKEEIVLRCGKGSITLKKDGKVVIRGTNLISRSSGNNKIKGGAVHIN